MDKVARYKGNIAGALIGAAIGGAYVYYAEDGGTTVATAMVVSALIGGVLGWLAANLWTARYKGNIAGALIGAAIWGAYLWLGELRRRRGSDRGNRVGGGRALRRGLGMASG